MNDHSEDHMETDERWAYVIALIEHLIDTGIIDKEEFNRSITHWKKEIEKGRALDFQRLFSPRAEIKIIDDTKPKKKEPPLYKTKLIFIVDDVKFIRDLIRNSLQSHGYTNIKEFENGYDAIEGFREHHPALVLMDVEMKGIDGLETFRQIQNIDKTIPVIIMTGNPKEDYVKRGFSLGVGDFLAKPLDVNRLMGMIEQYLKKTDR